MRYKADETTRSISRALGVPLYLLVGRKARRKPSRVAHRGRRVPPTRWTP